MRWQIAPEYGSHEPSSDTESTLSDEEGPREEEAVEPEDVDQSNLEKAGTQRDNSSLAPPTRPTTLAKGRTRSSRKEPPCAPVGFWHYKMVCGLALTN